MSDAAEIKKEIAQLLMELKGQEDIRFPSGILKEILADWHNRLADTAKSPDSSFEPPVRTLPDNSLVSDGYVFQLQERMRELQCLYQVLAILNDSSYEEDIKGTIEKVVSVVPDGFMEPGKTEACICLGEWSCRTSGYKSAAKKISSTTTLSDGTVLELHACRVDVTSHDKREKGSRPEFLKEEQLLLDKIVGQLRHFYEHHLSACALIESENLFRSTLYSIGDAVITSDRDGRLLRMNHIAEELTGWKEPEARGRPVGEIFRIVNEYTRKPVENPVDKVLQDGRVVELANHTLLIARDGREVPISDSGAPIVQSDRNMAGVILVFRSQLEERLAQNRLEESEYKFRSIVEGAPNPIYIHADQRFVYVNPPAVRLFRAESAEELIGTSIWDHVHPDYTSINKNRIDQLYARKKAATQLLEQPYIRLDGSEIWVETIGAPITYEEKDGAVVFVRDISERRHNQQVIRENLKEKEVMLAEIHHRVKNNMAVISGLLELEAHQNEDPSLKKVLQNANTRIRSMALIHEKLYQSESLSEIEFGTYMKELAGFILEHFELNNQKVNLSYEVEPVFLDITQAIPLGIIFNEVITNGMKYAVRDSEMLLIKLELKKQDRQIILTYQDNGPGFSDNLLNAIESGRFTSLGVQLVFGLTRQLKGHTVLKNKNGARIEVQLPQVSRD